MGFALRIKDVSFANDALGRVNYIEPIPCTGIELDKSTLSFESAEESQQITATLTPSDTTDALTWVSSNDNVATVEDGLVTIHGIGSATITATCGTQIAVVEITQTTLKAQYPLKTVVGHSPSKPNNYDVIYVGGSVSGANVVGQSYHGNADLAVFNGTTYDIECIRVPYGATKILCHTTDGNRVQISYGYLVSATEQVIFSDNKYYAKYISRSTFVKTDVGMDVEYGQAVIFHATDTQLPTLDYFYFT